MEHLIREVRILNVELLISDPSSTKLYIPIVEEGIEWSTERRSTPGKLTFKIVKDSIVNFQEGAAVHLLVDGKSVFYGFVFTKKRNKNQIIEVTAYDQLRYLKNKDTFKYDNKTAKQIIEMVAKDYSLNIGALEDTRFVIAYRNEEDTTLFDIIETALDLTLQNTKEMFVLYDDFGKLTLKNISSMYVIDENGKYLMIDDETEEDFEYTSSIDSKTYNKIVLKNKRTNKDFKVAHDLNNIAKWGTLVYTDTYSDGENGQAKANALLKLYNSKTRNLRIKNAIGDTRVRAGSILAVNLALGDVNVKNFMMVEKVKHIFKLDEHFMDLTLRGGEFIG